MAILNKNILVLEGGYSNDENDHGGETKFGITKAEYPNLDIKNLTAEQALAIYQRDYFDKFNLGQINDQAVADVIFYLVVNCGYSAIKIVQKALNNIGFNIAVDGIMGAMTMQCINHAISKWYISELRLCECQHYLAITDRDETQIKFFRGWIRRALS